MVKVVLVCLSYTGNTWQIGEAIKKGINPLVKKCDMVSLRRTDSGGLAGYDLIGIGSPVRLGKMPAELKEFIDNMGYLKGKHCFVFNTHAALPVNFMKDAVTSLRELGLMVIGFKNWYCSVFLPYVPKPYFTDRHPDQIDLREAEDFGREMVDRSRRILNGETHLIQELPEGELYNEIYGAKSTGDLPVEVMQARSQGFTIDMSKCIRCGYCEVLCPTHSVDITGDTVFQKCDQCWLCEQTCPVGAISFNYPPLLKAHNIVIQKRFIPSLQVAEQKGRFRPLVRPEEVKWELPPFVTKNPPRFKVIDDDLFKKKAAEKRHREKSK